MVGLIGIKGWWSACNSNIRKRRVKGRWWFALTPDVSSPCSARSICQNASPTYKKREIYVYTFEHQKYDIPGCQLVQPVMWLILHQMAHWYKHTMDKTDLDVNDFTRRHFIRWWWWFEKEVLRYLFLYFGSANRITSYWLVIRSKILHWHFY